MKRMTHIILAMILIEFLALGIIVGTSKVQNMTLETRDVSPCNTGWMIQTGESGQQKIDDLPYYGHAQKDEMVVATKTITEDMCGKTLYFLSADKTLEIFVEDNCIYSFGINDKRKIGHTPGSVLVFADIPNGCAGETLRINMKSAYKDYAAYITEMYIGDRDVDILHFLKMKTFPLICCMGILICGIILVIFAIVQSRSSNNKNAAKLYSLGLYFLSVFIYHLIETKVPMIYYGNQYLYSNLVFISLMVAPFFLELYMYEASERYRKLMNVLIGITCANILGQLILQISNVLDFMNMAFISHGLLATVIIVVLIMEIDNTYKRGKVSIVFFGILITALCCVLDLVRCYTVKVGDMGTYSRIGILIFGISMVITNIQQIVQMQVQYAEKQKSEALSEEIIQTLVAAIDAKDVYTKGHSTRVADYAAIMAQHLGWSEEKIDSVRYKALLHDIGKIGIPDRVLNKADRLTDEEFEIIKSHTVIGSDMLQRVSSLSDMYLVARHHHERYDGKGYPDGLAEKEIPEEARLVGIVDAYDAMSSDRAYRKALPASVIRGEMIRGRGSQFDPDMTDLFMKLFDSGVFDLQNNEHMQKEHEQDALHTLNEILKKKSDPGALKIRQEEISNIYQYISGIHARYGIDYNTVLISLVWEGDLATEELDQAMKAMEYSIRQSLRKVDVMTRISESQFLVVLTEVHIENLQMVVERIFASFFKNCLNTRIKPIYEIK